MQKVSPGVAFEDAHTTRRKILLVPLRIGAPLGSEDGWEKDFHTNGEWVITHSSPKGLATCGGTCQYDLIVIEPQCLTFIERFTFAPKKVVCTMQVAEFAQRCKQQGFPTLIISTNPDALKVSGVSVIKDIRHAYSTAISLMSSFSMQ
jgi:hypothetical protein